jgi:UDP-4-amino-4,6-dideoxy-N-acetyl-beta-L-altrosamine transaminase
MIPYGKHHINQADIDAVINVLKSDFLTQGPQVPFFEEAVANYCGVNFGTAVNSATSALHIACLALGVKKSDWVWTSSNSFVASANCALYCDAKVDFVDIDPKTYNMCVRKLEEKLLLAEKKNKLPKVVIPVHFAGQSCNMKKIFSLSQRYGFKVIEDSSHAIGGRYLEKPIGGCQYSDITVFSFHPVKIITAGEGGMAVTNDPELSKRLKILRSHGISNQKNDLLLRPEDEIWNFQQLLLGFNYRMTDLQAALCSSQLSRIDEIVHDRHSIAENYNNALRNLPLILPQQNQDSYSSFHLYPIRLNYKECNKTQISVYDDFIKAGVNVNIHYIPIYLHPYYESMGFKRGYCPESEKYFKEAISLPIYPTLKIKEQDRVIQVLQNLFE